MPLFSPVLAEIARDLGTPEAARVARRAYRREFVITLAVLAAVLALCLAGCGTDVENTPLGDGARRLGSVNGYYVFVLRDPETGAYVYAIAGSDKAALAVLPADAVRPQEKR